MFEPSDGVVSLTHGLSKCDRDAMLNAADRYARHMLGMLASFSMAVGLESTLRFTFSTGPMSRIVAERFEAFDLDGEKTNPVPMGATKRTAKVDHGDGTATVTIVYELTTRAVTA
jgi:hypothetical protein